MNLKLRLRYQLTPTPDSVASRVDLAGSAKIGKASPSTLRRPYRKTSSIAPIPFEAGSNGFAGATARYAALSPVSMTEPVACHAVLSIVPRLDPLETFCDVRTYSPRRPNRPA